VRLFDAGAREGPVVVHDKVVTAANGITAIRLLGLPLFVWLMVGPEAYGMGIMTLAVTGCSDWVDGYVARRFDQVTRLGQIVDPLVDRLLLATAAITLMVIGFLPWLVVVLILARDAVLLTVVAIRFRGIPPIPVNRTGKFATACLLIGVPGYLLGRMDWPLHDLFRILAVGFTVVGIATYYLAGYQYAQAAKALVPTTGRVD
jgi:cardiolipin synthase